MLITPPPARAPEDSGLRSIPGDPGPPLIGYTLQLMHDPIGFAQARRDRYGPVSWLSAFGTRMVTASHPDTVGAVLQNPDKAYASGPAWSYFIGPFFRRGIMLLDFDEHLRHRRILQQAFTVDRLKGYLAGMTPVIGQRLAGWRPRGSSNRFLVYPAMKQLTLDLSTDIFMGARLDARPGRAAGRLDARAGRMAGRRDAGADRLNRAFVDCVRAGTAYLRCDVPGLRWSRGLAGRRVLEDFLRAELPARHAGAGADLFSVLCHASSDEGERFTDDDIVNHMIFLLMAAHDTSTITMTVMCHYLAMHPQWQQRCRAESLALGDGPLSYDDLAALTSLDLVMKESLRLVAPVPSLPRRAVVDTELLGYFIPAGTLLAISPHVIHHLAEHWPDPERFDPERFAEGRREDKSHRHAWTPFGAGAHKCIGMHFASVQVKAVMHELLRRYEWSAPAGCQPRWDFTSLPRPKDGLPVRLAARHSP